jgi:hypothetical protein
MSSMAPATPAQREELDTFFRTRVFQKLPKQTAPYVMLRQHMLTGNMEALREAVLLGTAWGISREWLVHGFAVTAYYTGFEALSRAHAAVADIL